MEDAIVMRLKVLREEELEDKICVVVGTRPGIIKFSPIIRELGKRRKSFFVLHSGQHYSYNMDKMFFDELDLPKPEHELLDVRNEKYHGEQTAKMLSGSERAFLKEKPKIVLVGGDANTNLAGALAARKLHIYVGHIEAGLRSNDWRMPEEHNRVMIDHISDFLFAPTKKAKKNLVKDNVKGEIFVTGNTIVDAIEQNLAIAGRKSKIIQKLDLTSENYFLLTLHREENVDFVENLVNILKGIKMITENSDHEIIFPVHPRTMKRIEHFKLRSFIHGIKKLKIIDPLGYLDFLMLLKNSGLVLTDSGGIQEESCIMKVPCVTLRESTERPETVEIGANYVSGTKSEDISKAAETMLNAKKTWRNPFGNDPARKIVDMLERF